MAWNIAGVDRRTRDAAVEAARRAGMRLDDWLDEVITDYARLDQRAGPERNRAEDDRLGAAAGRLERIARRNERAQGPRAPAPEAFNSAIEHFEMRLARAEEQAARAFETVAQILDRDDASRDSDRRALIDAVRRLDAIRTTLTSAGQTGEKPGNRFPQPGALDPKAPFDLKAAVSQIAMRRHELEERAGRSETGALDASPRMDSPPAEGGPENGAALAIVARRRSRPGAEARRHTRRATRSERFGRSRRHARRNRTMGRSLADLAPRNAIVALEGAIRDLVQRVEMLRQSGHGESMLAPLEAMAAEFHAALRAA